MIPLQPQDSLYVLDLINFEWYVPKVSRKSPSSRSNHKANVIGKCCIWLYHLVRITYMYFSFKYD